MPMLLPRKRISVNQIYGAGLTYQFSAETETNPERKEAFYIIAKGYYQQAVLMGSSDAQFNLGNLYECGLGGKKDIKKAITLYEKASSNGHKLAFIRLFSARAHLKR